MAINMDNKQVETKLYDLVSCLADNYGFDADTAFEYARWETDVDHVGEIVKMLAPISKGSSAPVKTEVGENKNMEAINACKKNITLWEKKLADGKVTDVDKQREKIDKEKKKLAKLETKNPETTTKKEEPVKKEEPKKDDAKEKRIKRMSPVMADQLKKALTDVNLEFGDKLKKEFVQYVDDLTDDDFKKVGLADHMRDFAKLKAPPAAVDDDKEEEIVPEPTLNAASSSPSTVKSRDPVDITLEELQSLSMTANVEPMGTLWDADNGRFVRGPSEDEDEDFCDNFTFDGKDYVVGEKTGRVYEARKEGDFFSGFIGVGKFKNMKKPE